MVLWAHTRARAFNGPFSGTTRVSQYQKGKTNLDFTEGRDSEWQWHQLGHMQVCTLLQTDNHASTPPLSFYRPDTIPAAQPTSSKHWRHSGTLGSALKISQNAPTFAPFPDTVPRKSQLRTSAHWTFSMSAMIVFGKGQVSGTCALMAVRRYSGVIDSVGAVPCVWCRCIANMLRWSVDPGMLECRGPRLEHRAKPESEWVSGFV